MIMNLKMKALSSIEESMGVNLYNMVVAKGRQTIEFIEDHVGQVIVKHVNLHVSYLAALAVQIPLGVVQDMVGHQSSNHMMEGFLHHGISVEVGIHAGLDLMASSIVSSHVKGSPGEWHWSACRLQS
jgi:ABC-type antimicrobial peptide transport system permease subunit